MMLDDQSVAQDDSQDPADSLWRAAQQAFNRGDYSSAANLYGDLTRRYANSTRAEARGNAQRLLRTEPDPDRGEALQTVVRQTQRIAGILRDLMQFARPPKPEPRAFAVSELIQAVRACLAGARLMRSSGARS